jgi:hypothetical protein
MQRDYLLKKQQQTTIDFIKLEFFIRLQCIKDLKFIFEKKVFLKKLD